MSLSVWNDCGYKVPAVATLIFPAFSIASQFFCACDTVSLLVVVLVKVEQAPKNNVAATAPNLNHLFMILPTFFHIFLTNIK